MELGSPSTRSWLHIGSTRPRHRFQFGSSLARNGTSKNRPAIFSKENRRDGWSKGGTDFAQHLTTRKKTRHPTTLASRVVRCWAKLDPDLDQPSHHFFFHKKWPAGSCLCHFWRAVGGRLETGTEWIPGSSSSQNRNQPRAELPEATRCNNCITIGTAIQC